MDLIHFVVVGATFGLVGHGTGSIDRTRDWPDTAVQSTRGFKTLLPHHRWTLTRYRSDTQCTSRWHTHADRLLSAVGACVLIWIAMDTWRAGTNASELNLINTKQSAHRAV